MGKSIVGPQGEQGEKGDQGFKGDPHVVSEMYIFML